MTQNFKGDAQELKFQASGHPLFDQISMGQDAFLADGYNSTPFLLMLYDQGRIPFSERIQRTAFVAFVTEALQLFPFFGTFETHLFILRSIFGDLADISFDVPGPGILNIDVSGTTEVEFDFVGAEADGVIFEVIDDSFDQLVFRGISGVETAAELSLIFSEMIPAGISPHISLDFFTRYNFIADDADGISTMVDEFDNEILFVEIG